MQFKVDENLPVEMADLLNNAGHDAKTVNDQQLQGATDPALIAICNTEERVFITLDTDFSDIRAYPPEQYSGIIIFRLANQAKPYLMDILKRIISLIGQEPLKRHLWIVEEARIRVRGK